MPILLITQIAQSSGNVVVLQLYHSLYKPNQFESVITMMDAATYQHVGRISHLLPG